MLTEEHDHASLVLRPAQAARHLHNLRRSGVRNMIRRGVPESVAMRLVGHKTRSMLDRYNILDGRDLRDAADLLTGVAGNLRVKPRVKQGDLVAFARGRTRGIA